MSEPQPGRRQGRPRTDREHLRRGPPRRRLAPDRLAGHQRPPQRPSGDPCPRRAGDRPAPVQPVPGGPRPGHPPDPHHRAGDSGHLGLSGRPPSPCTSTSRPAPPATTCSRSARRPTTSRGSAPSSTACSGNGSRPSSSSSTTSRCSSWCASLDLRVPVVASASTARRSPLIVSIDQYRGARSAVRHLAELGHTRILHLAGPRTALDAIERARGWRDELAAHRLEIAVPEFGDWSAASGYRARLPARRRARRRPCSWATTTCPSACCPRCASVGCASRRTSASSASTTSPRPATSFPPLTTVRQDFGTLGEIIMQKVLIAIEEPDTATEDTPLPTHLIVRQSTRAMHPE